MKRLKFPAFILALGFALVSAFAFSTKPVKSNRLTTTYFYIGDYTDTEINKPENWVDAGTACGSSGDLPCTIDYPGDRVDFDLMVEAFEDVSDANDQASTRKNL